MEEFSVKEFNNIIRNQRAKERTIMVMCILFIIVIFGFVLGLISIVKYYDSTRLVSRAYEHNINAVSKEEALIIDAKSQIEYFADHFYTFDATNIENQIDKALWISDNSVKALFEQYKRTDWYNKIVQYNIFQTCEVSDINVDITQNPAKASFSAVMLLKQGANVQRFTFTATCDLVETTKVFPKNEFGFIITNYQQSETKLIK